MERTLHRPRDHLVPIAMTVPEVPLAVLPPFGKAMFAVRSGVVSVLVLGNALGSEHPGGARGSSYSGGTIALSNVIAPSSASR